MDSGKAVDVFGRMVHGLGGPVDFIEKYDSYLPKANIIRPVYLEGEGYVSSMNTREVGVSVVQLGGGRKVPTDPIDYSVGITGICALGDHITPDRPIAMLHANDESSWNQADAMLRSAIKISDSKPEEHPCVYHRIG